MVLVRTAEKNDIPVLLELEEECWDEHLRVSSTVISRRVNEFITFVAETNGSVVGVLYTKKVTSKDDLIAGSFTKQNITPSNGSILQLMAIATRKAVGNVGSILRNHALDYARENKLQEVVAMTRCSKITTELPSTEYSKYVHSLKDPTIFFHVSGGAAIEQIVPNYRPEDVANLGNAVMVCYALSNNNEDSNLAHRICSKILSLVGKEAPTDDEDMTASSLLHKPFLDIIDSNQMMELHGWIALQCRLPQLSPTFLFTHTTAAAVEAWHRAQQQQQQQQSVHSLYDHNSTIHQKPYKNYKTERIAIVGVAFRFLGGIDSFAKLQECIDGKKCLSSKVPFHRWSVDPSVLESLGDPGRAACVEHGTFLDDIELFDPAYFNMNKLEVMEMDPSQRLVLEMTARALHDSGKVPHQLQNSAVGVYVGMSATDYHDLPDVQGSKSVYAATGSALSVIAGRVSHQLGLNGPSCALDTACSSSLVAMQQAMMGLRSNHCDLAVVASANLMLAPGTSIAYARAGMTSPDGKCHTFDESANGYCRGEGCAALILKRMTDAEADGDKVYGVLCGSAVMHGGRSASITAPNGAVQEKLLNAALLDAGLLPEDLSFVEAHGTGTILGDPIEVEAIAKCYGTVSHPVAVSSIKANLGHLEATAGMAGICSAILAVNRGMASPNCHLNQLNQKIEHVLGDSSSVCFPIEAAQPLHRVEDHPLTGGVSSFGYSGTIAHVIIEEPPTYLRKFDKP